MYSTLLYLLKPYFRLSCPIPFYPFWYRSAIRETSRSIRMHPVSKRPNSFSAWESHRSLRKITFIVHTDSKHDKTEARFFEHTSRSLQFYNQHNWGIRCLITSDDVCSAERFIFLDAMASDRYRKQLVTRSAVLLDPQIPTILGWFQFHNMSYLYLAFWGTLYGSVNVMFCLIICRLLFAEKQ